MVNTNIQLPIRNVKCSDKKDLLIKELIRIGKADVDMTHKKRQLWAIIMNSTRAKPRKKNFPYVAFIIED